MRMTITPCGVQSLNDTTALAGKIEMKADKQLYEANDLVKITVNGTHLNAVNALGFALPYQTADFDFISITPLHVQTMENLSNDRLHTNGAKVLYPTFINVGNQETAKGNQDLFIITFKAKRKLKFDLKIKDGILVDKKLNVMQFD